MSMECNKDEALRAKEIAERKLKENDFAGARRVALKAQRLFPELDNISQLLTVCDVHCSAENRILGTEKDWYSILQIEKLADEATIKKQYRKLALALHPDKNKFHGAEAAFKIIGEAHILLSDRSKRAYYDSKVGVAVKSSQPKPPSYKVNTKPPAKTQTTVRNNDANGFRSQSSGQNQANSTANKEPFWTCCPYCSIRYQFYREVQNKNLRCQKCTKVFVAYEVVPLGGTSSINGQAAAQGMPGSFVSQAAAQGVPGSKKSQGAQGMSGSKKSQGAAQGVPGSKKSQGAAQGVPGSNKSQAAPPFSKPKDVPIQGMHFTSGLKTGGSVSTNLGSQGYSSIPVGSGSGTERGNAKVGLDSKAKHSERSTAVPEDVKLPNGELKKNKKRGRKSEPESSDSDMSDDSIMEDTVAGVDESGFIRRSNRQKHQVSYNESVVDDDDDFESPPKRLRKEESSHGKGGQPDGNADGKLAKPVEKKERNLAKESIEIGQNLNSKVTEEAEVVDVTDGDGDDDDDSGGKFFEYPDPEFNDFEKLRAQSLFAADQFWACYGDGDGMPRFYARIKKVHSSPFRVSFTWLEPNPDDDSEIKWAIKGLPVACGKFIYGDTQTESNVGIFSHQIVCEKGKQRGNFMVYPRKGEAWAVFKDWDIEWSSNPDKHKNAEYEIVEVLSNFVEGVGVEVALLEKLRGFVSLVQCRSQKAEIISVPATEMFRFSHRIPFFTMSGTEQYGVPEGSFELDPAGVPESYVGACHLPASGADDNHTKFEGNCSNQESSKMKKPKLSVGEGTPEKSTELRRSSRGQSVVVENRYTKSKESSSETFQFEAGDSTDQADRKVDGEASKSGGTDHSSYPGCKVSEYMLHDFKDRPEEKFKQNQIWALYEPEQKLPKTYGMIKKIEYSPLKLHVAALGSLSEQKKDRLPVCGSFTVKNGKPRILGSSSFSHEVEGTSAGKNKFIIHPKVGEVWAVYRGWNPELTQSDLKNCECVLVEIIGVSQGITKVLVLLPSQRNRRSVPGPEVIEIQENEFGRFSHQIPAISKGEGKWLVDAAAVPKSLLSGK